VGLGFGVARVEHFCVWGGRGGVDGGGARDEDEGTTTDGAVVADFCFPG